MVSQFSIKMSGLAREDLRSIVRYYAVDLENPSGAAKIYRTIHERINSLRVFPERGRIYPMKDGRTIRLVSSGSFNIYFKVDVNSKNVIILRIAHAHRATEELFRA